MAQLPGVLNSSFGEMGPAATAGGVMSQLPSVGRKRKVYSRKFSTSQQVLHWRGWGGAGGQELPSALAVN